MRKVLVILIFLILSTIVCAGGNGNISHEIKISDLEGLFNGTLGNSDKFGSAVTKIGDLDADGVNDIVVGHRFDDEGGSQRGAVWVLFLNSNGTVKSNQKIASNSGNFSGSVSNGDNFGTSVADIGDLNGDGITDLVVGAPGTDDGDGNNRGAVWILFMKSFSLVFNPT